jgi:hypothetical protein
MVHVVVAGASKAARGPRAAGAAGARDSELGDQAHLAGEPGRAVVLAVASALAPAVLDHRSGAHVEVEGVAAGVGPAGLSPDRGEPNRIEGTLYLAR